MKTKILVFLVTGIATASVFAASSVWANSGHVNLVWGKRLDRIAQVLGLSSDALKQKLKSETFSQVLTDQRLTKATFRQKMLDKLKADWKAQGLTDDQINLRLQARTNHRLRAKIRHSWK